MFLASGIACKAEKVQRVGIVLQFLLYCLLTYFSGSEVCYPPNKPYGGYYKPKQGNYQPGAVIEFECSENYFPGSHNSSPNPSSICQESGLWSAVRNSFCDGPPLEPSSVLLTERLERIRNIPEVTDGNTKSCHSTTYEDRITWSFSMKRRSLIVAVRIYCSRGETYRLEVIVKRGSHFGTEQTTCGLQEFTMLQSGWIVYRCPEETWGQKVFIKDWTRAQHIQKICEVQIFSKGVTSCLPPMEAIGHGYLEYGRTSATLVCFKGFKPNVEQPIVCQEFVWKTNGRFCIKDDKADNGNFVIAVSSSVLIVVALLVIVSVTGFLCYKRRRRLRSMPSVSSTGTTRSYFSNASRHKAYAKNTNSDVDLDPSEHEYSEVRYSQLIDRVKLPTRIPTYANVP